ncbi:YcnI family protein [Protaetiibacter larvae]|uniref:YcnI family protein n=1 Tax=Protaetiibacter larvae TaxID=2592654 RepID=A0A5C1Y7B6_9MICO|nr:YcnI family protein [Protaetiibacter larvae]QEO09711.1 YcnI family protein [Protaetiibacter larvae]
MSTIRRGPAALAALAGAAALALAAPLSASAHVTLETNTAAPGSYALLTFTVPTESADASTTTLTLTLPADTPFASVRTVPVPGWTAELVRTTLPAPVTVGETELTEAVTSIVWTADAGGGIRDGELGLFPVSLGPVPDVGHLALPVDQGYSDGSVVSWSGTAEGAERPAPVLYVNDAPETDHHGGGSDDEPAAPEVSAEPDAAGPAPVDVLARVLGVAGLAVGAVGVTLAIGWRRRANAASGS